MSKKSNRRRKDGRIAIQVYLGKDENSKRKYKTVYGRTQKEATQKADELKFKIGKGIDVAREDDSFELWRNNWLIQKRVEDVSDSEYSLFESRSKYFVEKFGHKSIKSINVSDVRDVINELAQKNPYTGKPTAKRTLSKISKISIEIFDYAIHCRVTDYNPAQFAKPPKNLDVAKRRALTKEERKWIEETPHRAQLPAMIMMYSGLRRGELTALQWSDINLKNKTIKIDKSFDFKENKIKSPKTEAGYRTIPIPDNLIEFLQNTPKNSVYVVTSAQGYLMTETAWKRLWESYMVDLDIKYGKRIKKVSKFDPHKGPKMIQTFTLHELRHTYCTILYEAGVDVLTAQYLMGHSDVKTTLAIYTHLEGDLKQKNIDKLNKFLKCKSDASQDIPTALEK